MQRNYSINSVEILSLYQPLYSVHEKKYIGVEALSRGIYKGDYINAGQLFSLPANQKEKLDLNIKCIENSLGNLKKQEDSVKYSVFFEC